MANAKQTNVSVPAITEALFNQGINEIKYAGTQASAGVKHCVLYILTLTDYKSQQSHVETMAKAYQDLSRTLGKEVVIESAVRWVRNQVKKESDKQKLGFTWAKSESAAAAKKRAARAGKKDTLKTGAPKEVKKPTPVAAMKKENWQDELTSRVKNLEVVGEMFVPAGKIPEFRAAFSAFLLTLEKIIK